MASQLTKLQEAFIDAYLGKANFNATEAARLAKYKGNGRTLASVGWENLRKPEIAEEIKKRLQNKAMGSDETLVRLGEHARADYKPYLNKDGEVDMKSLLDDDKGHLIKGIKKTKYGNQVEFYSSQSALALIAKHHGLLVDKVEQRNTNIEIDFNSLNDDQVKRLANGEDATKILAEG